MCIRNGGKTMKKLITLMLIAVFPMIAACSATGGGDNSSSRSESSSGETQANAQAPVLSQTGTPELSASNSTSEHIPKYSDVRVFSVSVAGIKTIEEDNYAPEDIITYTFNMDTLFPGNEKLAAQILENGKNPGLGICTLHKQGITGKGIKVAIIDQNLAQPFHPEFSDSIIEYKDFGTNQLADSGSMHGPAVASLLVGKSCGVAPDAELYFAAAPSWTLDSYYFAKALRWIIETNRGLPSEEKIRVVSVSAAPSGTGSPFKENLKEWDDAVAEAQAERILVLDCRAGYSTGIIAPGYYDPAKPDDVTLFTTGFPTKSSSVRSDGMIFVPTSFRATAEEFSADHNSYQFTGQGGLSWGIPYAAGVLALGLQVDPSLTNEEIIKLLFDSAYTDSSGNKIINPPAFIAAIKSH